MDRHFQTRIMQYGSGWYWEVVADGHEVIARGLADTHAKARDDADKVAADTETVKFVT